jgi:hypothetical protein
MLVSTVEFWERLAVRHRAVTTVADVLSVVGRPAGVSASAWDAAADKVRTERVDLDLKQLDARAPAEATMKRYVAYTFCMYQVRGRSHVVLAAGERLIQCAPSWMQCGIFRSMRARVGQLYQ